MEAQMDNDNKEFYQLRDVCKTNTLSRDTTNKRVNIYYSDRDDVMHVRILFFI